MTFLSSSSPILTFCWKYLQTILVYLGEGLFFKIYYTLSITIYPPYTSLPPAITTLLALSMSPFSFLLDPSNLQFDYRWSNLGENLDVFCQL